MKTNQIAVIIFTVSLFVFAGCSGDESPASPQPTATATTLAAEFQSGIYDTHIINGTYAGNNFGSCADVEVSAYSDGSVYPDGTIVRALFRFDLGTTIPSNSTVDNAHIVFSTSLVSGSPSFTPRKVKQSWTEGSGYCSGTGDTLNGATWNHSETSGPTAWAAPGTDISALAGPSKSVSSAGEFTVTLYNSTVQDWLDTPSSNYGIVLKMQDEAPSTSSRLYVRSSEYATVDLRPKLVVEYTEP